MRGMDSAVGPVPHTAARFAAKQKPVRSKYATQPRGPSVLKPMTRHPSSIQHVRALGEASAVAAFAVAASERERLVPAW